MKNFGVILAVGIFIIIAVFVILAFNWPQAGNYPMAAVKVNIIESDKTVTIMSDDKNAFLEIRPGAVPTGLNLKDIRLLRVPAKELFGESADENMAVAYRLTPREIIFGENIEVTVSLSSGELNIIPFLFYDDNNEIRAFSDSTFLLDEHSNKGKLTGLINKFNLVGVYTKFGIINYDIKTGGTSEVGDEIDFRVDLWPDPEWQVISTSTHLQYAIAPGTAWQVGGVTFNSEENILEPVSIIIPKSFRTIDEKYSIDKSLKCIDVGIDRLTGNSLNIEFQRANKSVNPLGVNLAYYTTDKISFIVNPREYSCSEKK